ncbi:MAG: hypothetical protein QXO91_04830 [Desulfurococcaceae archaeon]
MRSWWNTCFTTTTCYSRESRDVKKLIEDTSPGGGLILTTGVVEIPPETPNANLIALKCCT